ncbi:MAG: hydantoinase B/oxoprolinase family protein, partial [Prochlorococcaceae cyanobacterium]
GGDGVGRRRRFLAPMTVALLSGRRGGAPFGLAGGEPGLVGRTRLLRAGAPAGEPLSGAAQIEVAAGDVLVIETPGGGGFGAG